MDPRSRSRRAGRRGTDPSFGVLRRKAAAPKRRSLRVEPLEDRNLLSDIFFLHQSVGQGIMDDHGGHPGLVSQLTTLGHHVGDYNLWNSPPASSVPTAIASLFADTSGDGQYGDLLGGIPDCWA